jgi:uncharacterized protein involved in outer membrane biogenesis
MKSFFSTLSGIIIGIFVILLIVLFFGWSRIPDMLAHNLSKQMKVPVTIEEMTISLSSIGIEKLEISNPPGSILSKALSIGTTHIQAPILHYFDEQVVIDEVRLDEVYLGLEFQSTGNRSKGNWPTIMKNLNTSEGHKKSEKSFLIKKLILSNIAVDLVYKEGGGKIQHLPAIDQLTFTNVTSQKGIPTQQLANVILQESLKSIFQKENLENMIKDVIESPTQAPKDLLQPLQQLFSQ